MSGCQNDGVDLTLIRPSLDAEPFTSTNKSESKTCVIFLVTVIHTLQEA